MVSDNKVEDRGIWISANGEIVAHFSTIQSTGCGGTALLPLSALGWNYYAVTTLPPLDASKRPIHYDSWCV